MKMERVKSEYIEQLTQDGKTRCVWLEFRPHIPFLPFSWQWHIGRVYQCAEEATEMVQADDPVLGKQLEPYCFYHKGQFLSHLLKNYEKAVKKEGWDFLGLLKGVRNNDKNSSNLG